MKYWVSIIITQVVTGRCHIKEAVTGSIMGHPGCPPQLHTLHSRTRMLWFSVPRLFRSEKGAQILT